MPRAAILWVGVITLLIAIYQTWREVQRTSICDTTYIYEGYANVALPSDIIAAFPRYKFVRYNDNAPHLQQDIADLRHRHRPVPLLFVHGHLGTPQQMRSMASESSREVIRRYKSSRNWNLWIDWYAVDFNTEPSAFEPHLLEEQARFVAACLRHLGSHDKTNYVNNENEDTKTSTTSTTSTTTPLLLVGYSMGGLVVEAALEHLDENILQRLALVLTLGSPRHHLPGFLRSFQTGCSTNCTDKSINIPPSVHILAGPGDLMIPGLSSWASIWKNNNKKIDSSTTARDSTTIREGEDQSTRSSTSTLKTTKVLFPVLPVVVQVDMDDVPGVWCTASHKGMISCNQLVRQTVPLLVDAASRSLSVLSTLKERKKTKGGKEDDDEVTAVATIGARAAFKLTTSLLKGMPETVHQTQALLEENQNEISFDVAEEEKEHDSIAITTTTTTTAANNFIFTQQFERNQHHQHQICYIWDVEEHEEYKFIQNGSLFFLFSGLAPGTEFRVLAEFSKKERKYVSDVSVLARPLPGMMKDYPSASDAASKQPWHTILAGVDWMQNSTRILGIPFGSAADRFSKIKLEINLPKIQQSTQHAHPPPGSPPPTFIAQLVPDVSTEKTRYLNDSKLVESLHTRTSSPSYFPLHLQGGQHPLALHLDTVAALSSLPSLRALSFLPPSTRRILDILAQVFIGQALPFRIQSTVGNHCANNITNNFTATETKDAAGRAAAPVHVVPFLIAIDGGHGVSGNRGEDTIIIGDVVRKGQQGLPLWHPSVIHRDIWFILDPRCSYTLSLVWDLGPWLSYTLRYHAYALLSLTFALSLLDLLHHRIRRGNKKHENNSIVSVLPLILVLFPALSSVWPEYAAVLFGRPPWLPLSSIDVCLLGSVAYSLLAALKFSVSTLQLFFAPLLKGFSLVFTSDIISKWLKACIYIGVVVSSGLHPAVPALLGILVLSCTAASTPSTQSLKNSWLVTHILASIPVGIWIFGWIASEKSHEYPVFTLERVFMLIQGAHSCTVAFNAAAIPAGGSTLSTFIYEKITLFSAVFVSFSGLWGSLHVVIPAMAIVCCLDLLLWPR